MFIVFEGIDGCGKSTLSKAMQAKIQKTMPGRSVTLTAEPTRHLPTGVTLRQHLAQNNRQQLRDIHFTEYMALLMAADRQWHYWQEIYPALRARHWVLCDRFTWSSLAYQAVEGMNVEWLVELNSKVPEPDLTVVIELDIDIARQRMASTRAAEELFESEQTLRRVASQYSWMTAQKTGIGLIDQARVLVVDGRESTEHQLEKIWQRLELPDEQPQKEART